MIERNRNYLRILLPLLAVIHASLVFAIWYYIWDGYLDFISAQQWLVAAWSWLVWFWMLFFAPYRSSLWTWIALVAGVLLLTPCTTTIFAVTVWSINGFAP